MNADERAIRELVATWMSATRAGDIDTVLALMADDAVFLQPGQPPMIGKAAFAAAARSQVGPQAAHIDGSVEIREIQVHGERAFMWASLTVAITPPGAAEAVTRKGHTLSVLVKATGKWLLARDANMLAPA